MNVLFVKYGLDRAEFALIESLHKKGINIKALIRFDDKFKDLINNKHIESVPYHSKFNLNAIKQIRRIVVEDRIDIIHAPCGRGMANSVFATLGLRTKIIGYRGTLSKIRKSDPSYWLTLLNPKIKKIICVNQSIYDYMLNFRKPDELVLAYKGYDPTWNNSNNISFDLSQKKSNPNNKAIVCISNTEGRPHKGMHILVEAFSYLNYKNAELFIIGRYNQKDKLRASQLSPNIHFLGHIDNALDYLIAADVFVLPSTRDGLPRAIKEAMSLAKPIVSTNISGINELINHKISGLLVPPNSPKKLASGIDNLLTNTSLAKKLGKNARSRILTNFSPNAFSKKIYHSYIELMNIKADYDKLDKK